MKGFVLIVTMVLGCSSTPSGKDASGANGKEAAVGTPAPEITAEYVTGDGPRTLADAKGVVTLVDFWATFCAPCRKSFPVYQALVDKHAGKLAVIAVSVDEPEAGAEEIKKFASETDVSFAIVWDKEDKTACPDGCPYNPPSMPTSYLVDQEGVLRGVHEKFEGGDDEKIDAEVDALMK